MSSPATVLGQSANRIQVLEVGARRAKLLLTGVILEQDCGKAMGGVQAAVSCLFSSLSITQKQEAKVVQKPNLS